MTSYTINEVMHGTVSGPEGPFRVFDHLMTGQGNDELGSGFYFTSDPQTARSHAMTKKMARGPDFDPVVYTVDLEFQNPIFRVDDQEEIGIVVEVSIDHFRQIILRSPDIHDEEKSPLNDWDVWRKTRQGREDLAFSIAVKLAGRVDLRIIEGDWFDGHASAFRGAVRSVLGYDSVIRSYDNKITNYVAWFKDQIKIKEITHATTGNHY